MLILRITLVLVLLVMAESTAFHRPWLQSLIFALALAVGLTPEHLPTIMTITMARGAVRLSRGRLTVRPCPVSWWRRFPATRLHGPRPPQGVHLPADLHVDLVQMPLHDQHEADHLGGRVETAKRVGRPDPLGQGGYYPPNSL